METLFDQSVAATFRPVIPPHVIDAILHNIYLPDFVGETVALAKKSATHEGICPFHNENTPSFHVYPDHYHCYGCGAHGNAIDFLMQLRGRSFLDAVRALASQTGITIPHKPASQGRAPDPHRAIRDVLRRACAKYQQLLLAPDGTPGMAILNERGIDDDTIIRFGIGFAPEGWGTLTNDRTFRWEHLLSAGLASPKREKKGCFDFFRNRLLFPIRDLSGDVIGFGGRRVHLDGPKYLNTPETALYSKGNVLFGMQQARQAIRLTGSVIVCEGFFDVITPAQAGIEHIVSTCGTALTEYQAEQVLSAADRVFFCFDGDPAGIKASWRAATMLVPLVSDRHEVRFCQLPAEDDPDSFVRKHGADTFRRILETSPTLSTYLAHQITREANVPESRAQSLMTAGKLCQQFAAPGLRFFFRQNVCESLQLHPDDFEALTHTGKSKSDGCSARACPCCGHPAFLLSESTTHRVVCSQCQLSTTATPTESDALQLWNRRERPQLKSPNSNNNGKIDSLVP